MTKDLTPSLKVSAKVLLRLEFRKIGEDRNSETWREKKKLSSDIPVLDNSVDNFYVSIIQREKKYSAGMY